MATLLWRQERSDARAAAARAIAMRTAAAETTELRRMIAVARAARADVEKQKTNATSGMFAQLFPPIDPRARPKRIPLTDVLRDHPEYAAIRAKELYRHAENSYGAFLDTLGLDPAKRGKLLQLLEEREATEQDFKSSSAAAGLQYQRGATEGAMAQATQDIDQGIEILAGSDAKTLVRRLNELAGTRAAVVNMSYSPDFWDAGVPLTQEQTTALAEAYEAAVRPQDGPPEPPRTKKGIDPGRAAAILQTRLLAQSQGFLSPEQQQVLEQHLQDATTQATIIGSYLDGAEGYGLLDP